MRAVMGLEIGNRPEGIMKLIVARERVGRVVVQYPKR
jgi:cyclohexanecarboxyl-CoA dehydrogenase